MPARPLRAIIVEPEVLIALDVERILDSIDGWAIEVEVISRLQGRGDALACDLLLCAVEHPGSASYRLAEATAATGAAIVLLTTSDELLAADLPWARVPKPFLSEDLVATVVAVLAARA